MGGHEVLDSRGNPTVEDDVRPEDGVLEQHAIHRIERHRRVSTAGSTEWQGR